MIEEIGMSAPLALHDAGTILLEVPGRGVVLAAGDTVPTGAGYTVGCIFIHMDGAANSALYVNEGTASSASFVEVGAM
jgi:hypothetical protein